jgi:hypothetical protein
MEVSSPRLAPSSAGLLEISRPRRQIQLSCRASLRELLVGGTNLRAFLENSALRGASASQADVLRVGGDSRRDVSSTPVY